MLLFLILSSVSSAEADFASDHLHNFLNQSVSPCDNFYRHVCSKEMDKNATAWTKSENFYKDIATQLKTRTLNNPVMNDITEGRGDLNCTFDADVYSTLLRERCSSNFQCYFDEFLYFYTLYNATTEKVDDSLKFYSTHGNKTNRNIIQSTRATSKMVELLYKNSNSSKHFNDTTSVYTQLNDRLFVMEFLNENDTADHVGLEKIHNLAKKLKDIILRRFQETPWMHSINQFGFTILGQYMTILDELVFLTDYDNFDRNLTTLRKISRDMTSKYFEFSPRNVEANYLKTANILIERKTGCAWFDVVHSFNTTTIELEKKYTSNEDINNYYRAQSSLSYNAYNYVEASIIVFLAPIFYPLNENATDSTMIGFSYIIGHEIFHSFVTEAIQNRSEEYKAGAECLQQQFNQSCALFAEGECQSGSKTFSEDGPDVEGARAAFELLQKEFTKEQLMEFDYPDLRITREQSFFYSIAMRVCADVASGDSVHSPWNIRVNSMASQMPDFSRVFSCQPDDLLYSEPDGVCYLFGKNSTGAKRSKTREQMAGATTPSGSVNNLDEAALLLDN